MQVIDAAEARHRQDLFWRENKTRSYNERIMNAIIHSAENGKGFVQWGFILPQQTQEWLESLGFYIDPVKVDYKEKIFQFFIRWDKMPKNNGGRVTSFTESKNK